ncbi:MAG: hypothetical protein AAFX85_02925 [Pseudomonadota bacterium]
MSIVLTQGHGSFVPPASRFVGTFRLEASGRPALGDALARAQSTLR